MTGTRWSPVTLGEIVELHDSKRIPLSGAQRQGIQGKYRYYGASGVIDHVNKYIFDGKYLLVAEDGENLNSRKLPVAFIAEGKFWVNNHAHILTAKNGHTSIEFLKQWFAASSIAGYITGAAQPKLSQKNLKAISFSCPPPPEQQKIAAILTAYDDLIENNRQRIALLEKMAEEIYREWFVRLRFPGHEHTPVHKGVPEGWSAGTANEIVFEASRSTKPGTHLEHRKYVPIDVLPPKRVLPEEGYGFEEAKSSLVLFEDNDILFGAMRPYQHKVCIANTPGVTRSTCFVLRPYLTEYAGYAYWTIFQSSSVDFATLICNGVDRPYVVWTRGFERLPVFIPPKPIAAKFQETWEPVLEQMRLLHRQSQELSKTRDLLLNRLISGKLRVDDLDIQFPPSMREAKAA